MQDPPCPLHWRTLYLCQPLTVLQQPLLDRRVLPVTVHGGEGGALTKAVAELHGSEPVELEVAVEVAAPVYLLEGQGTGGVPVHHPHHTEEEEDNQHANGRIQGS